MILTSETQKPADISWVHEWERGLDPWHADAFPSEHKHIGTTGERAKGWYALDWCGNVVGFVPDGSPVETKDLNDGIVIAVG